MNRIRIALIGAGAIAADHARSLSRIRAVSGLIIWDPDASRTTALAQACGGTVAKTLPAAADSADVLWICSPPFARLDAIKTACRRRIPIFCEKPIALEMKTAGAIRRAVRQAGITFFMGQSGRFAAFGTQMKKLVEQGAIGAPRMLWSTRLGYLDRKRTPAWRMDDKLGGGTLVELGIHELDFIRWIGGGATHVAARAAAKDGFQHSVSGIGSLADGAAFRLDVSWASPRYLWQRGVEGDEGSLFFDDSAVREVRLLRPGKSPRVFRLENWLDERTGENTALRNQARDVIARILDGQPPAVSLEDGAANLATALAIRKAAARGTTVKVTAG